MQFKRMVLEVDNFPGSHIFVDIWTATKGDYSFIIAKDEEGYTASYKDNAYEGPQVSNYIMNGDSKDWKTFKDAVHACGKRWQELRRS